MDLLLADLSMLVLPAGQVASSALLEKRTISRSRRSAVALLKYALVIRVVHSRHDSPCSYCFEFSDVLSSYFWVAASLFISDFVSVAFYINGAFEHIVLEVKDFFSRPSIS